MDLRFTQGYTSSTEDRRRRWSSRRGSPLLVTALAANEVDVANLGFSTLYQAVNNAGLSDMKVIADEAEDAINGFFASQVRVRKDSGINKIEDLKGKVVATIAIGSG